MFGLYCIATLFLVTMNLVYAQANAQWPGWSGIRHIFSFGDSYTDTRFLVSGTQPNAVNPLGNPAFPGRTFSNGRNWLDFLVYAHNDSQVFAYNFAKGGASVDSFGNANSPFRPFDIQVQNLWMPKYGSKMNSTRTSNLTESTPKWSGDDSLFTMFFGINDINLSYRLPQDNRTMLHDTTFRTYAHLVDVLYKDGARNFLFMNIPAVHRAPFTVNANNSDVEGNLAAIEDFNGRLDSMLEKLISNREDVRVFKLDNLALFNGILDGPQSRLETAVYRNTTGFCPAYSAYVYPSNSSLCCSR